MRNKNSSEQCWIKHRWNRKKQTNSNIVFELIKATNNWKFKMQSCFPFYLLWDYSDIDQFVYNKCYNIISISHCVFRFVVIQFNSIHIQLIFIYADQSKIKANKIDFQLKKGRESHTRMHIIIKLCSKEVWFLTY